MKFLFTSPTLDDLIRLLRAWRFWMLGAMLGALIGAAVYFIIPPPFRAQATVNVDFNLEQAWPQETDRQQFYYLERESRKLEELAWSDDVMGQLSSEFAIPVEDLRGDKLHLSQPAEAGWHRCLICLTPPGFSQHPPQSSMMRIMDAPASGLQNLTVLFSQAGPATNPTDPSG